MFYDDTIDFNAPMEERLLMYPKDRQAFFVNLVENYKIFCPMIKMIYAGLNYSGELKSEYLVIFEGTVKDKAAILWDCPFIYTNRALPAYRYALKTNQCKSFFESCMRHFAVMDRSLFYEFIQSKLCENLSLSPSNEKYWKAPENFNILLKGISECGLMYRPSGFKPKPLPPDLKPNPHPSEYIEGFN